MFSELWESVELFPVDAAKNVVERALEEVQKKQEPLPRVKGAPEVGEKDSTSVHSKMQARAEFELTNIHRNLKTKKVEAKEEKLTADKTAEEIAADRLGADATADQKQLYAKAILSINSSTLSGGLTVSDKIGNGTTLKLPGQTSDGGITWVAANGTNTIWTDMSAYVSNFDGSGMAHYDYQGESVQVKWDRNHVRANHWITSNGSSQTDTSYDEKGRNIKREFALDPNVPSSIVVTENNGVKTEFKPDGKGEYVPASGTDRMTSDGRIYTATLDRAGNTIKQFEDRTETYDKHGRLSQSDRSIHGVGDVVEIYKSGKLDRVKVECTNGNTIELTPAKDHILAGIKKDSSGKVVDANMRMKGDDIYSETNEAGQTVRKYENGVVRKFAGMGFLLEEQGKDSAGRDYVWSYKLGEVFPYKKTVKLYDNESPTEFTRTSDGRFVREEKSSSGSVLRTTELRADGSVQLDAPMHNARTTFDVGGSVTSRQDTLTPIGQFRQYVTIKGTELNTKQFIVAANGKEIPLKSKFVDPLKNSSVEIGYNDGKEESLFITRNGSTIDLKVTDKGYVGDHRNAAGDVVDHVVFKNGQLLFQNIDTGAVRAEKYSWNAGHIVPQIEQMQYDVHTGVVTNDGGIFKVKETYSPGRFDIETPLGSFGLTVNGDLSYQRTNDHPHVFHSDGSGAEITDDGKIRIWDRQSSSVVDLTAHEASMAKDAALDKRYMLEIHRRFAGDAQKIDRFYENLEKLATSENLTDSEKQGLIHSLMHHVAYPAEIYQGSSPTCNVTTVQRDLAMVQPDKYAAFIVSAINDEQFTTTSGTTIKFDVSNLKMQDYSGRDIGSRVFQTAALNVLRYPKQAFRNTVDGAGKWIVYDKLEAMGIEVETVKDGGALSGLYGAEIARVNSELTGESKALIDVTSANDFVALFRKNSGPVTIMVDADTYPFSAMGAFSNDFGGHVVTVTGIEDGPPVRVLVQNQWGLGSDHSSATTAVELEDVFNNMSRFGDGKAKVIARAPSGDSYFAASVNPDGSIAFAPTGKPQYDDHLNFVK